MRLTRHCSRRVAGRVGVKSRRRQQSWIARAINNATDTRRMPDGTVRYFTGRWVVVYDKRRGRAVTIWETN
jgi:hypothetical protein